MRHYPASPLKSSVVVRTVLFGADQHDVNLCSSIIAASRSCAGYELQVSDKRFQLFHVRSRTPSIERAIEVKDHWVSVAQVGR